MCARCNIPAPGAAFLALSIGAALGVAGLASPARSGSSCSGHWWVPPWPADSGFDGAGASSSPRVFAGFDPDGPGPAPKELIVGGFFDEAPGGVELNGIARYTNGVWVAMGPDLIEIDGNDHGDVEAMVVFDLDGPGPQPESLIVGGYFETAGATVLNNIGRWDGTTWHPIGTGLSGICCFFQVNALAIFDSDGDGPLPERLFAAGNTPSGNIRVWTGTTWGTVSGGVNDFPDAMGIGAIVTRMIVVDFDGSGPEPSNLVVAGTFSHVGGTANPIPASFIARWDGTTWHALGAGPPFVPDAMEVFDLDGDGPNPPRLIIGGPPVGHLPPLNIARTHFWDGSAWQQMGPPGPGFFRDFTLFDPDGDGPATQELIAGGSFPFATGDVARWNGRAWEAFQGGANHNVYAVDTFDFDGSGPEPAHLIVGGLFTQVGTPGSIGSDIAVPVSSFARWGCFTECPADLDDNGIVDGIDLAQLLVTWTGAASYRPCRPSAVADLNNDCRINGIDLAILLVSWGNECD